MVIVYWYWHTAVETVRHIKLGVAFVKGSIGIRFLNDWGSVWVAVGGWRDFNIRNLVYWIRL